MFLKSLKANHFKNYQILQLDFCEGINVITGLNGSGKTNLLDAVFYLCNGKSYFNSVDQQLIWNDETWFNLKGTFYNETKEDVIFCSVQKGKRKTIKRNEILYNKIADHYGYLAAVMIAPGDIDLINGMSEDRRKWMDSVIALINHEYLHTLIKYEKLLQQRNAQLKQMADMAHPSIELLQVYDEMVIPLADYIHEQRIAFTENFFPYFELYYALISSKKEVASWDFLSKMNSENFKNLLLMNFKKDMVLQRTSAGPHRDDLEFKINGLPLKKFGSQGQQKSFLLALKLAQFRFLSEKRNGLPILLLDDVCERLDEERLAILFELIAREDFGQIFVSDASKERLKTFFKDISKEIKYFNVERGVVSSND